MSPLHSSWLSGLAFTSWPDNQHAIFDFRLEFPFNLEAMPRIVLLEELYHGDHKPKSQYELHHI